MELGFIGLGKMGLNMVTRLLRSGDHQVVVYNRSSPPVERAVELGANAAGSLEELVGMLAPPRRIWLMIPAGRPVDETIDTLAPLLDKGDIIVDGGNSNYKETMERARGLREKGVDLLDVGTSGGVWGLEAGYCMMAGGEARAFEALKPAFETLAPEGGYARTGPSGSGHYVKMIHNGIEYGMLQAYAEGFSLLEASDFGLDLEKISTLWGRGSVIRSWLLELAADVFREDAELEEVRAFVEDSGEGRWTVLDGIDKDVPCPVITLSLLERFRSRQENPYGARVIAALRNRFGGHAVKR